MIVEYRISLQPIYQVKSRSTVKVADAGWSVDVSLYWLAFTVLTLVAALEIVMLVALAATAFRGWAA